MRRSTSRASTVLLTGDYSQESGSDVDAPTDFAADRDLLVRTVAQLPTAVALLMGPEHVYVAASQSYLRVAGKPVMGRSYREAFPELEGQGFFERVDGVYASGETWSARAMSAEWDADEDGVPEAHFIDMVFAPVRDAAGAVEGVTLTVEVVDDRVKAEREHAAATARTERLNRELEVERSRLEFVFQQAPAFLAVLREPTHVFVLVNDAYLQLIGHRDIVGKPVLDAMPEIRDQGFVELLDAVLESGEPYIGREMPIMLARTPGAPPEERFVDFIYMPLVNADGEREGVIAHGMDVTDEVLSRRQVQGLLSESEHARAEAEGANRAKSEFLANMSHELRTPINAVLGYTDLMELGIPGAVNEGQREYLERIKASGTHLLGLVEDILDLAKVEAGRMEVARERGEARDTIAAALPLILPQAEAKGILTENLCAVDCDYPYVGDEDRVRQVLVNLLSNAVKFTEPGGRVTIDAAVTSSLDEGARLAGPGPWLEIRVMDTGIGIAADQIESVFQPFVQAETGHTRTKGGTGLGLTISREFARLMGGDLTAESMPGEGTTFTLWLPADPASVTADSPQGLARAGEVIQAELDRIMREFVARLRTDPLIEPARELVRVDLEDHTAAFLADIAQSMVVLGETGGKPDLMRDGSDVQRLISELHGVQRARLGWTEEALRREFQILREEVAGIVRGAFAPGDASVAEAVDVYTSFLTHAEEISMAGFREATDGPGDILERTRHTVEATRRTLDRVKRTVRGTERDPDGGKEAGSGGEDP